MSRDIVPAAPVAHVPSAADPNALRALLDRVEVPYEHGQSLRAYVSETLTAPGWRPCVVFGFDYGRKDGAPVATFETAHDACRFSRLLRREAPGEPQVAAVGVALLAEPSPVAEQSLAGILDGSTVETVAETASDAPDVQPTAAQDLLHGAGMVNDTSDPRVTPSGAMTAPRTGRCEACGGPLPASPHLRRTCSTRCRVNLSRRRGTAADPQAGPTQLNLFPGADLEVAS